MSTEPVVDIQNLTRRYGSNKALDDVSLVIPPGIVMGIVGENGAGKTTLIKHVLGLLRAQEGTVRVFGLDPVAHPVEVLSRIGYLSEEGDLPAWMRVDELLRYAASFYKTWDEAYATKLLDEFRLDRSAKLSKLSKGQRSRAGLVVAMAYRPPLLVLDEPSSGLDPIVRRDILMAIVRTIADEGRTVLFSSHLLGEVERVSDRVALIKEGRIVLSDSMDNIKEGYRRVTLMFDEPREVAPQIEDTIGWEGKGREWSAVSSAQPQQLEAAISLLGARVVERNGLSLDDIFVAHARTAPERRTEE